MKDYLLRFKGEYAKQISNFLKEMGLTHIPLSHYYIGKRVLVRYNSELWSNNGGASFFWKTETRIIAKSNEVAEQIIGALEKKLKIMPEEILCASPEEKIA